MKKYRVIFEDGFLEVEADNPEDAKRVAWGEYISLPVELRQKGEIENVLKINPFDDVIHKIELSSGIYIVFADTVKQAFKVAEIINRLPKKVDERLAKYCDYGGIDEETKGDFLLKITAYISALRDAEVINDNERALLSYHYRTLLFYNFDIQNNF